MTRKAIARYARSVAYELPEHVVSTRRDGKQEVLLHRAMAVMSDDLIEIKSARGTVILPLVTLALCVGAGWFMAERGHGMPIWVLMTLLLFCLVLVPFSLMSLIGAVVGADVVIDRKKGSATWQQGYLGMGIGTKELVPFGKIDHFEVTVEGDQPDRWQELADDLRQFALVLVKKNGKRLTLAQVPVPAYGQTDGMDRTLAVGQAVSQLTGAPVRLPEGWELVEIDSDTGQPVAENERRNGKAMDAATEALRVAKRIAVVGLDSRTDRPAHRIASYLQEHGYTIVPVHRGKFAADEVLGEKAYASLRDVPGHVDIVDVFVRGDETDPIIDDAIAVGAGAVWLQVGIRNDAGLERAEKAGLVATQDRCAMVVHRDEIAGK
ncbi:MAG TPA: CoA-binding protein [Tepidiformaceae bacterium]|nr:CoA-binding protein [Tepidiformaceae bacterium]